MSFSAGTKEQKYLAEGISVESNHQQNWNKTSMEVIKMKWLKELLEKAKITDGKLNVDEVMEAAKKEFPKHAVPKNVFNDKCQELKTANETITTLKKENGDNEELQNKIKDYETEIGNLKTAAVNTSKQYH